jgi:CO/xanthine dehydrogenase FAD-binding subunit
VHGNGYSHALYGAGGMLPDFVPYRGGVGRDTTPIFDCSGGDIRQALATPRAESGEPYEGLRLNFVKPATRGGASMNRFGAYKAVLVVPFAAGWRPSLPRAWRFSNSGIPLRSNRLHKLWRSPGSEARATAVGAGYPAPRHEVFVRGIADMKPASFDYVAARSSDEAVAALARGEGEAKLLAGGQSLVPMLNFRLVQPAILIDINRVPGLAHVTEAHDGLRIGALTRHRMVETSPLIAERFPVLAAAMTHVAHLAIRNRGTVGGSLAHADPAAELPMLALLLDARITTVSPSGARTIAAKDFFLGALTTALDAAEIVTEVELPAIAPGMGWGFEELARRRGDFAIAAVCALVAVSGKRCTEARIALVGGGETARRANAAEMLLRDRPLAPETIAAAARAVRDAAAPSTDLHASADYRRHVLEVLTRRALDAASARASGAAP